MASQDLAPAAACRSGTPMEHRRELLGGSSLQRERLDAVAALLLTARERLSVAGAAFLGALQDVRAAEVLLGELGD